MSRPGTVTHVLHWVPPYVGGDGTWELQDIALYRFGEPPTNPGWGIEGESRDINANDFTDWIASLTGYPVTVEKSWTRITCPRALRFWRKEPVWLVRPADGRTCRSEICHHNLPEDAR